MLVSAPESARSPLSDALRDVVFDGRFEAVDAPIRDAVLGLRAPVGSDVTFSARARRGYDQLRAVSAELGSARELVDDPQRLFSLFEWSAIAAPDLAPVLSGHFPLTVGAIMRLGSGTPTQQEQLRLLDDARHVGVFLLTELGYGSNVLEMETEATWDAQERCFLLNTPRGLACKFMPNVAADDVPKLTIVAARMKVDGKDEGVYPFVVPLRGEDGLLAGVDVVPMPDKGYAPMDNAMIRFDRVRLPYDAWLAGGTARIDDDGAFVRELPAREQSERTIGQLQAGRVGLSCCSVAAARAALALTTRYAAQRRTGGGIGMLERDNVQRSLASCVARVYAATALANTIRRRFSDPTVDPADIALLAIVSKPLITGTALAVLQECRERCGAQGMFRVNRIPDYIGNTQGSITAEGENQVMQANAGRALRRLFKKQGVTLELDRHADAPWWHGLLVAREQALACNAAPVGCKLATTAIGPGTRSVDLAAATADRLAADALLADARDAAPSARASMETLATVYGLEQVRKHAAWYVAVELLSPERAADVERGLADGYAALGAQLPELVEAFAIPDALAPMADDDYIAAWLETAGWSDMDA